MTSTVVVRVGKKTRTVQLDAFNLVDCEFKELRRLLKAILPADVRGKEDYIAVAGSAPLFWLQRFENVGPIWPSGPADIDVFVCGIHSDYFSGFVEQVLAKIAAEHYVVTKMDRYHHSYGGLRGKLEICDLTIRSVQRKLSLIQCPSYAGGIQFVIDSFDINVCRVVYSIDKDEIRVAKDVYKSIKMFEATVADVPFGRGGPDRLVAKKVSKTIERMAKYRTRGFRFRNGGGVVFVPSVPAVI